MIIKINKSDLLSSMMNRISFTDEEINAIRIFQSPATDGKSKEINHALYNDDEYRSPEIQHYIDALTSACDKGILGNEFEVQRGEYFRNDVLGSTDNFQSLVGKIFDKKGFLSTSLSKPFNRPIIYKIKVPKGTHAIYLKNLANNSISGYFEDELLIQRGYKLQIDTISRDEFGFFNINSHLIID